ncbi:GDSL esterase/lipase At5g45960-like [Salvia splendens]|uniref:GDSL esterase/lipase At5g45960-like n=1 Tax=Salvia splendens TaxID=180675 RepID=UPI001C2691C6|nr:GDSL esterase/lipase At5g45960-like [Salvia splendens]
MFLAAGKGKLHRPFNNTVSAVFVFGDSTVDVGNNNNLMTILKSDFRPYGIDLPNKKPTGRFSNGRLVTDFIAAYAGIKEFVPAYSDLQLSIEDLMTGVSFASGASGFDEKTPSSFGVITMKKQVENLREYTTKIAKKIGKKKTKTLIEKSVSIVSAGSNDIFIGSKGVRNVAVVGLSQVGCAPAVVTLNPGDGGMFERKCNDSMSAGPVLSFYWPGAELKEGPHSMWALVSCLDLAQ